MQKYNLLQIAAVYGLQIRIFEPSQGISTSKIVPYQWHEVHRINVKKRVSTVQWVLEGLRLLVMCSSELILYQHQLLSTAVKDNHSTVTFSINEEVCNKTFFLSTINLNNFRKMILAGIFFGKLI